MEAITVLLDADSAMKLKRFAALCNTPPHHLAGHLLCVALDHAMHTGSDEPEHAYRLTMGAFEVDVWRRGRDEGTMRSGHD